MADPAGREAQDHLLIESRAETLQDLAARLGQLAIRRGVTIGTAESCTAGLVGHGITSVPGSSAYYLGGVVSYADATKIGLIGVPRATIERHGRCRHRWRWPWLKGSASVSAAISPSL